MKREPKCACKKCVELCRRNPGWMTPQEARAAMAAGYAPRMMRDWLEPCAEVGNDARIYVLAPASRDCEGRDAPELDLFSCDTEKGRCVLLTREGKCEIHDSGFKPIQCRTALGCQRNVGQINYETARLWDNDEGRAAVAEWMRAVGREAAAKGGGA